MRKNNLLLTFAVAILGGIFSNLAGSNNGSLYLEISTPKDIYIVNEPLIFQCKFKNTGKDTVWFPGGLTFIEGLKCIDFYKKNPDGILEKFRSGFEAFVGRRRDITKRDFASIAPGESLYSHLEICYGGFSPTEGRPQWRKKYLFAIPGEYEIFFYYKPFEDVEGLWRGTLESNHIVVNATDPSSVEIPVMQEFKKIKKHYLYTYSDGHINEEEAAIFKDLAEKFPRSILAPYFYYQYAGYLVHTNNYELALKWYQELQENYPGFFLNEEILFYKAFCFKRLGDSKRFIEYFKIFRNEAPANFLYYSGEGYELQKELRTVRGK